MSKGASTHSKNPRQAVAVLTVSLSPGAELVQLTPDGVFRARDGRPKALPGWKIDPAIAQRVLARLHARKNRIVVDYEHQTLLAEKNGQPAPAAGWIEPLSIQYREGEGFFAPVEWTARAKSMIEGDEYKYISPVLPYDPQTGEVLDILHVALTNDAAVDGMAPVAALSSRYDLDPATPTEETDTVDRKELIKLLGLADDATDAQIQAALKNATGAQAALAALRIELNLDENGDASAAIAALKTSATAAKPDLSQYVPKAVYEETRQQLAELKTTSETGEMERLIQEGLDDGRIAGKATADHLRTQGLAALKAHLADSPSIAALKATQTQGKMPADDGKDGDKLSEEEIAVCKAQGLSHEAFLAAKKSAA